MWVTFEKKIKLQSDKKIGWQKQQKSNIDNDDKKTIRSLRAHTGQLCASPWAGPHDSKAEKKYCQTNSFGKKWKYYLCSVVVSQVFNILRGGVIMVMPSLKNIRSTFPNLGEGAHLAISSPSVAVFHPQIQTGISEDDNHHLSRYPDSSSLMQKGADLSIFFQTVCMSTLILRQRAHLEELPFHKTETQSEN